MIGEMIVSAEVEHFCAMLIGVGLLSGFIGFWFGFFIGSGDGL